MKKAISLLLCLLMLSFAACGETNSDIEPNSSSAGQAEVSSAADEQPEGDAPAFDTSWAGNEFEALLPELPFTGWTTAQEDDSTYKMELGGLNTSPATNPPDSGEEDGADKAVLVDYLISLPQYGFTVEETGADYEWTVTDAAGNSAEFMCAEGYCWITIQKAQ